MFQQSTNGQDIRRDSGVIPTTLLSWDSLPANGSANALLKRSNLILQTERPYISNMTTINRSTIIEDKVASNNLQRRYGIGHIIYINVTFTHPIALVLVTGGGEENKLKNPYINIKLANRDDARAINIDTKDIKSKSGTYNLTFSYTIKPDDENKNGLELFKYDDSLTNGFHLNDNQIYLSYIDEGRNNLTVDLKQFYRMVI